MLKFVGIIKDFYFWDDQTRSVTKNITKYNLVSN